MAEKRPRELNDPSLDDLLYACTVYRKILLNNPHDYAALTNQAVTICNLWQDALNNGEQLPDFDDEKMLVVGDIANFLYLTPKIRELSKVLKARMGSRYA